MLRLAVIFLVLAMAAGLFGFGLVAGMAYDIARVLFFLFLVLFVVALIGNLASGRARPSDIV